MKNKLREHKSRNRKRKKGAEKSVPFVSTKVNRLLLSFHLYRFPLSFGSINSIINDTLHSEVHLSRLVNITPVF